MIITEKIFYTVTEFKEAHGLSTPAAYRFIKRSGFPTVRSGKRILIPVKQLDAWLAAQTRSSADETTEVRE